MSADVLAAATVRSGAYAVVKRGFDVAAALLLILLTAPLLALSCAAVWLLSGRPLFHRRRVVGRGGRSFDAFKVRTMVADADRVALQHSELRDAQAGSRKLQGDPRVTSVGRVLRRCSLDELPQLL
ncbi:MAG: sugar transferase, partial [Candidatus Dormibacteraeota bacterium]|nr:sugar transferase [Candidatus Dormibacteraeota bacterium]